MNVLKKAWQAWKRFGQFLGDILARVVLTLFYFTLFLPFGIGVTWFSDPLRVRKTRPLAWLPRHPPTGEGTSLENARRQF
jgi:hypothetical protein